MKSFENILQNTEYRKLEQRSAGRVRVPADITVSAFSVHCFEECYFFRVLSISGGRQACLIRAKEASTHSVSTSTMVKLLAYVPGATRCHGRPVGRTSAISWTGSCSG
jgi:hypothetical protein